MSTQWVFKTEPLQSHKPKPHELQQVLSNNNQYSVYKWSLAKDPNARQHQERPIVDGDNLSRYKRAKVQREFELALELNRTCTGMQKCEKQRKAISLREILD
jgi:hypothetical protein